MDPLATTIGVLTGIGIGILINKFKKKSEFQDRAVWKIIPCAGGFIAKRNTGFNNCWLGIRKDKLAMLPFSERAIFGTYDACVSAATEYDSYVDKVK